MHPLSSPRLSFGKFQLLKRIGGGRLSEVFLATQEGEVSRARVALKRIRPALLSESIFVQILAREAGLLARLSHPFLCSCHELGVIDGCTFFTMDLIDGCTLRALMRKFSNMAINFPVSAILALGYQLAQVLSYLHQDNEYPLAHLDLSPQNVMIRSTGEIKLIDFGISRQLDGSNPPPFGEQVAGTMGYMSPEQAMGGQNIDARADQYGLGILLWEMFTGRRLFPGNTEETWSRMQDGQVSELTENEWHSAPESMVELVYRLLSPDPEARFSSMSEVAAQMKNISSAVVSGKRPLAALVERLLSQPEFDPYDGVKSPEHVPVDENIPQGDLPGEDYVEMSVQMEQGNGSPAALLRAVMQDVIPLSNSPFVEIISDSPQDQDLIG